MPRGTRQWSAADQSELQRLYAAKCTDVEIAEKLGHSAKVVGHHRRKIGPPNYSANRNGVRRRPWEPEEDGSLRRAWAAGQGDGEIADQLGRTAAAVKQRRADLGLTQRRGGTRASPQWSEQELSQLRQLHAAGGGDEQIAEQLGRTRSACKRKRCELGIVDRATDEPPMRPAKTYARMRNREDFSAALVAARLENDARTREARPPLAAWTPGDPSPEARPLGKRSRRARARA